MALVTVKPTRIDGAIAREIAARTNSGLEHATEALTWGADEHVLVALAAAGWLYVRLHRPRKRPVADHLLTVSLATAVLPHVLKSVFDQTRPDRLTLSAIDMAFPSPGGLTMPFHLGTPFTWARWRPPRTCCRRPVRRPWRRLMLVKLSSSALKQTRWYEYGIRFLLGGLGTVLAGIMGARFGGSIGGLFLALPAIFCASATLIESHERRAKKKAGLDGRRRGQEAAALDAAGAGLGSIGLAAFAAVFYVTVPASTVGAFVAAVATWAMVSVSSWWLRRKLRIASRRSPP